jgi:hypothetical protein
MGPRKILDSIPMERLVRKNAFSYEAEPVKTSKGPPKRPPLEPAILYLTKMRIVDVEPQIRVVAANESWPVNGGTV